MTGGELDEKVSVARLSEELLLNLLAILVHSVSDLAKIDRCILEYGQNILLLVVVTQYD